MNKPPLTVLTAHEACARAAHEMNRIYCLALGDTSQVPWDEAPGWQQASAIAGVEGALAGDTPEKSHESWLRQKEADGWKWGPVKDADQKTHPCMVEYDWLPADQRQKDELYLKTVNAMADALGLKPMVPDATHALVEATGVMKGSPANAVDDCRRERGEHTSACDDRWCTGCLF